MKLRNFRLLLVFVSLLIAGPPPSLYTRRATPFGSAATASRRPSSA